MVLHLHYVNPVVMTMMILCVNGLSPHCRIMLL